MKKKTPLFVGVLLIVAYTLLMTSADAITKVIAGSYEAPQLFAISSLVVVLMSFISSRVRRKPDGTKLGLSTKFVGTMALRSLMTVVASVAFFYAFRLLPFADVFLFIALMPLVAALLSGPVLGETVRPSAWGALALGVVGVYCLLPGGVFALDAGHMWALVAVMSGTISMLLSRYIGRVETNLMTQVFYPNLALLIVMGVALPFVWKPVALDDLAWILIYATILFAARYVVVAALRILPAFVAMPLMNMQFIWMVLLGFLAFGEVPAQSMLLGTALVILSGIWLVVDEHLPKCEKLTT